MTVSFDDKTLVTRSSLSADLAKAGIAPGDTVMAHTRLSALGYVVGGARSVIEALLDAVGPNGNLMMPTFSGDLSDPADWQHPRIPEAWIEEIRAQTPGYDVLKTPTRRMGTVAELFRHWPGVIRSPHPQSSFSSTGPKAQELTGEHPIDYRFGPDSPLGKLHDLGGKSILLGSPNETCTLYYLSQYRIGPQENIVRRAPVCVGNEVRWIEYRDVEYTWHWFDDVCEHLLETGVVCRARVGSADCLIFPAQETTRAVMQWRLENSC